MNVLKTYLISDNINNYLLYFDKTHLQRKIKYISVKKVYKVTKRVYARHPIPVSAKYK